MLNRNGSSLENPHSRGLFSVFSSASDLRRFQRQAPRCQTRLGTPYASAARQSAHFGHAPADFSGTVANCERQARLTGLPAY